MKSTDLKRISSLFIPFEADTDEIIAGVNNYIDRIDFETEKLERSYEAGNLSEFCDVLEKIKNLLAAVCAKRHEAYTAALTRSAKDGRTENNNKVLQQAIADFLLLSIEMQKAQNSHATHEMSDIEQYEAAARNLTAVVQFIDAEDYENAKSLVSDMIRRGMELTRLNEKLKINSYESARENAIALQLKFSSKITKVNVNTGTKTILAVDDRPEILTSVNAALQNHFKTLCAPSGKVALNIIDKQDIKLFILDIEMPQMNGFELTEKIRQMENHKDTPILFLTANSSRERIQKAIKLGISDFIVKPAYNETLLSKVKTYLN
ncbi:MAG: response regulator [Defluviitaleaceae bacterium]|nr:response regulator [Defluviitaleaceae bacterium]